MNIFERILREAEGVGSGQGGGNNAPAPWITGLDQELIGHAQNTGWDKLSAVDAAKAAVKAHREAQSYIGVPVNQVLKLPAKSALEAPTEWTSVYERLGQPKEAKEYDFTAAKFKDGTPLEQPFQDAIRAAAFKAHVTKEGALEIANAVINAVEADEIASATHAQATATAEKAKLATNWGQNKDAFTVVAERAAANFGVDLKALKVSEGYAATMEMFYQIGTKIGEDGFIRNAPGGKTGAMSKAQAAERKTTLMADADWRKRYLDGGANENQEMVDLIKIERAEG